MFLHIGGSRVVAAKDIVGIFDIRIKEKQCNREFLQTVKTGKSLDEEEVKSFIVTNEMVSYSPIAPGTLKKRFQANIFDK
ncbi:MAG: DUF370 domain-containing protein [Clostridiales bacterium]|jgi:hypothetical protein|nr:DUF370 domain-containing protein [Clostridiales bacterium]